MMDVFSGLQTALLAAGDSETVSSVAWGVIGVFGAVIASGIIVFGAARGIGQIASSTMESIARQPEAGGRLFTSMLLAAAFIEGVALFGLLVCFLAMWRLSS